ncbi:homoserine dehydrogenase [Desmospora profundinema]|uniref:Homoserine dehydrogenase n=1 Tax=Desmospora profundinema TaxID=1571184 RepID=A0ABU1IRF8_9BACL|nr:homoserine dehydrogenase [Desmospora profundinema]MDR6227386.1 homoserine dehydrogenase [Desmospora profundinema]
MRRIRVGLLGLGTVGSGVFKALKSNRDVILKRTDLLFEISGILVRDRQKRREVDGIQPLLTTRFEQLLEQKVDVVLEAIGGVEPARTYIERALKAGCHVVTANKELIAKHGVELDALAQEKGVQLLYEASVGGGIPVLGTLRHLLKSNRIHRFSAILNGTTNYILTRMETEGISFDQALAEAQQKGYAEADPTSDVDGLDAAYKLAILGRLTFEVDVPVSQVSCRGIRDINPWELQLARSLGYRIKLLAQGEQYGEKGPLSLQVGPALLPFSHPLARIEGVHNAVHLEGDIVQDVTLVGQGAGERPTASAMVEDLCNVCCLPADHGCSAGEATLLPVDTGGSRFLFLETRESITQAKVAEVREVLRQIGLAVTDVSALREGKNGLAIILRRWDPSYPAVLLAELGLDVTHVVDRPVFGAVSSSDPALAASVS